jgi:alpha-2-macroglobulin
MNKYVLLLLFVFSIVELAFAKPFYLTVRRDYSPKENPQLELNYTSSSPVYIKILEPEDKKQFISTQIDLRRAWKKPGYEFNPAHFMNLGFNLDYNNFDWIRMNLNYGIKKDLVDNLGGAHDSPYMSPTKLGPEKLIQIPKGFKLKTEIVLNPESEDAKKDFDVPGFEEYGEYMGSSRLNTKVINLPKMAAGFYLIQVIQGNNEGQVVLAINDLIGYMQRSADTLIYRVFDRNAKPIPDAQLSIRNLMGTWVNEVKTNASGEVRVDGVKDTDLLTVVSTPQGTAIIDSEYFSTQISFPDMYLFTDRPLYRNGDTISFKGILRNLMNGRSQLNPEKNAVKIEIYNVAESKVSKSVTVKFSEFGTFNGSLKLDGAESPGVYRVVAKLNKIEHASEVRVKEYVKPVYFVVLTNEKETAKKGDTLSFKAQAERYAGGFPKIKHAGVTVYRKRVESSQWIEDSGLGETGSSVTYGDDPNKGSRSMAPEVIVPEAKVEFDEKGYAEFEVKIPSDLPGPKNLNYQYQVELYTQDADDNVIYGNKTFFDLASEVVTQARFNKIVVETGKEAQLTVLSRTISGNVLADIEGEVKFILKDKTIQSKKIRTNAKGVAKVDLPDDPGLVGEMKAEVTLYDKKKNPDTQFAEIVLVGKTPGVSAVSGDEIRLLTNQNEVAQTDTIKIFAALPDKWGANGANAGTLFLTLAGSKIFKTQVIPVSGRSIWINEKVLPEYGNKIYFVISYAHPTRGWIEKRASFKILDPDKKLSVKWVSKTENVIPGSEQKIKFRVLNSAGKAVKAEVALSVVDQAVLDLQPEFRPKLDEFFYPLTRLNLMSFYSSHFQGYGYGEQIAQLFKPNHMLAASKNQSKPMDIKDTAFWQANIVTDANGEAEVKFNMPGNQTIWRATAVVLDKEGRFGESTTQFKSQLPISLLVGYPPFLRSADKSRLRVNVTGTEITQETPVKYSAQPENKDLLIFSGKSDINVSLKPKQQVSENMAFTVGETNDALITSFIGNLEFNKAKLGFKDSIRIFPKSTMVNDYYYPESNSFKLALEKDEKAMNVELKIFNDFTSILLSNMDWLIHYPYGCVEQTLNTTISNKVISDILQKAVAGGLKLSESETKAMNQAASNTALGFNRLSQFQAKTGGFGWFTDSGEQDINMSLLVMLNIALADRATYVNHYDFQVTYDWLTTKNILPGSPQGIVFSYIESVFVRKYIARREEKDLKTVLRAQNDYVIKNGTVMERALHIMTLSNHSFSKKDFINEYSSLIESVKKSLEQMKDGSNPVQYGNFTPQTQNGWAAYPGKTVSSIALAYRSLVAAEEYMNAPANKKKPNASAVKITYINDNIQKLVKKNILANYNGYHFGSTFDNGVTLTSLIDVIEKDSKLTATNKEVAKNIEVTVNDKAVPASDLVVTKQLTGYTVAMKNQKTLADQSKISVNSVIENQMVRAKIAKLSPNGSIKSKNNGWTIDRVYYKLNEKGEKKEIQPNEKLQVGELVYAEVKFKPVGTARNFWQSRYYVVTSDTPAGFQTIQEDQVYRGSPYNLPLFSATKTREILNHQTRWFFDFSRGWMDSGTQVGIVYRVQYPGEFNSGIAKIEDFYDETKASYTRSQHFVVESKQ